MEHGVELRPGLRGDRLLAYGIAADAERIAYYRKLWDTT
jgi:hypothetical protein